MRHFLTLWLSSIDNSQTKLKESADDVSKSPENKEGSDEQEEEEEEHKCRNSAFEKKVKFKEEEKVVSTYIMKVGHLVGDGCWVHRNYCWRGGYCRRWVCLKVKLLLLLLVKVTLMKAVIVTAAADQHLMIEMMLLLMLKLVITTKGYLRRLMSLMIVKRAVGCVVVGRILLQTWGIILWLNDKGTGSAWSCHRLLVRRLSLLVVIVQRRWIIETHHRRMVKVVMRMLVIAIRQIVSAWKKRVVSALVVVMKVMMVALMMMMMMKLVPTSWRGWWRNWWGGGGKTKAATANGCGWQKWTLVDHDLVKRIKRISKRIREPENLAPRRFQRIRAQDQACPFVDDVRLGIWKSTSIQKQKYSSKLKTEEWFNSNRRMLKSWPIKKKEQKHERFINPSTFDSASSCDDDGVCFTVWFKILISRMWN